MNARHRTLRWLAATLALLAAACISSTSADDPAPSTETTADAATGDPTGEPSGDPALGDITRITGTVEVAEIVGSLTDVVPLPISLTVAAPGGGNGGIVNGISVDGIDTSIVWDGGRPVTISGEGTIAVQPGPYRISDGALLASMGGAAHELSPGDYVFDGPAAIGGTGGLARPSDRTAFTATPGATFSGTGQVEGRLAAGTYELLGPGQVVLTGRFEMTTSAATTAVTSISMSNGSFELTVTTGDAAATVEVLLDGAVVAR